MTSYLVNAALTLTVLLEGKGPEGFEQILPRGHIVAISNPQYVAAGEARIELNS
jgi:hypothetical protein